MILRQPGAPSSDDRFASCLRRNWRPSRKRYGNSLPSAWIGNR